MMHLISVSLYGKEAERANDLANPEHDTNLQPMYSCELWLIRSKLALSLPLELPKTVCKRWLVERVFRRSRAVLFRISADLRHFALILAHHWRFLPFGEQMMFWRHPVAISTMLEGEARWGAVSPDAQEGIPTIHADDFTLASKVLRI
jgi:hypothetical protein